MVKKVKKVKCTRATFGHHDESTGPAAVTISVAIVQIKYNICVILKYLQKRLK